MTCWSDEDPKPVPAGLTLFRDFVTVEKAAELLAQIDAAPWDEFLARRVQHYGYQYSYRARQLANPLGPLPDWLSDLAARMVDVGFARAADQVIVNEYQPGQGIGGHIDSPVFGPVVASLSLESGAVMIFRQVPGGAHHELYLPTRSLLVLSGPARQVWRHSIPARLNDPGYGARSRRVSLTFRTVCKPL